MLGAITTAAAAFGPFFGQLRPTKSPYLLASISCTIVLCIYAGTDPVSASDFLGETGDWMLIVPLCFVCLLLFHMLLAKADETSQKESLSSTRLFAISLGISFNAALLYVSLFLISYRQMDIMLLTYGLLLTKILIFSYMFVYQRQQNIEDQKEFQLALLGALFMIGMVVSGGDSAPGDGMVFANRIEEVTKTDFDFILFCVFSYLSLISILYWMARALSRQSKS